jgi:hypothetical protein
MPFPAMPTQITCSKCGAKFVTQLRTIIDVGEEPTLKEEFLRGQVNFAKCPQCGSGGILNTFLLYHDPQKELLLTYVPAELGMSADQQEQYMGSLVNAVMNSVPAENRKAYFLQPKTVLTMDGLYDAILEGEGISKEALEAQRAKVKLMNSLLAALDDEKTFDQMVEEHRKELDYEFFLLLSNALDAHEEDGSTDRATALKNLREKLLARVTPSMPTAAPQAATYEDLIELLRNTKPGDDWRRVIARNRVRLDYGFFQALTAKIDAAQAAGEAETAQKLTELRKNVLDELDAQDKLVRSAEDRASLLIMELSEAQDLEASLRKHEQEIDEVFLSVLARYEATAQTGKDAARAAKLSKIMEATLNVLEEKLPPDVRLVNKLLRAAYPDGTNAVLEQYRGLLNDTFLATYDKYIASMEQGQDKDLAQHLKEVRPQIVAKISIIRA